MYRCHPPFRFRFSHHLSLSCLAALFGQPLQRSLQLQPQQRRRRNTTVEREPLPQPQLDDTDTADATEYPAGDVKCRRCPSCGRGYMHRQNMLNHLRFECGQRLMFGCCMCTHRTKLKGNLKKHLAKVHRDQLLQSGRTLDEVLAGCEGVRPMPTMMLPFLGGGRKSAEIVDGHHFGGHSLFDGL